MNNYIEVAITSEATGLLWSVCVWDPHVGTSLSIYKGGGVAAPHSLCLLGKDYLMISDQTKPMLQAWQLNSQQPVSSQGTRLVCPGRVTSMAVSPDGFYCITAIAEIIHVWHISSGCHMAVAVRHFQPVTCVCFTDDGSHFISGGDDGLVLVWPLSYLVSSTGGDIISGQTEPRYVFSDHSLPVHDLYVGPGGMRARLISVSADKTCKLYDLASGTLLLSLNFDCGLTAVTMDTSEVEVFVGGVDGNICQFDLHSPPRVKEYYLKKEEKSKIFSGHSKAITCLSSSKDGLTLLSGSLDTNVMLWHIPSRQCIRVLPHKGAVTNAFFTAVSKNMFSEKIRPSVVLHSFQKSTDTNEKNFTVRVNTQENVWKREVEEHMNHRRIPVPVYDEDEINRLKEKNAELKKINADLYDYAAKNILRSIKEEKNSSSKKLQGKTSIDSALYFTKRKQKSKKKQNNLPQFVESDVD